MNILITGGTKGIGLAIAHAFAKEGFDIAVCSRTEGDLLTMKKEFSALYPDIRFIFKKNDLSKKQEVLELAKFIKQHWNQLDVLVNNAGLFTIGKVHEEPEGALESQIETNLYSAYHLTRALLSLMLPHKSGHIFNMCSIASFMSYPNGGAYTISKFAMLGFSKALREEMKTEGIRVTSVMPGSTWSDSWKGADYPFERLMAPEDVALAVMSAWKMTAATVVEEIILRPQLGDL